MIDVVRNFFAECWHPEEQEYWIKMNDKHLEMMCKKIELYMMQNYIDPEQVTYRLKPAVALNEKLESLLRQLFDSYKSLYEHHHQTIMTADGWDAYALQSPHLKHAKKMLDALELYQTKEKENG